MGSTIKTDHQSGLSSKAIDRGNFPYNTSASFRTALKDRFSAMAKGDDRYTVSELQRQFAYDRALARLFTADDADRWVLKGAGALLARLERARHSKDIDLYYDEQSTAAHEAVSALRLALNRDIGDHFQFEVTKIVPLQEEAKGSRVHVQARLGPKIYAGFHIDVVVGTAMSGQPDLVAPLTSLQIDGLVRPPYRAFPLADHVADKFCAIITGHSQPGAVNSSSRIKDLVDIALIAGTQEVSGSGLRAAVLAGTAHRNLPIPDTFAVPDERSWRKGYPAAAADAPAPVPNYDEACQLAASLLNPILQGQVPGRWDPTTASWSPADGYLPPPRLQG